MVPQLGQRFFAAVGRDGGGATGVGFAGITGRMNSMGGGGLGPRGPTYPDAWGGAIGGGAGRTAWT